MGTLEIDRVIAAGTQDVWRVVTDWPGHARWMPLTRVTTDEGPVGVGWTFTGLTGLGRLCLRDPMTVTDWHPPVGDGPGSFGVRKGGRVLAGWAQVSVTPHGAGTLLRWREELTLRPVALGRLLAPVTDRLARLVYARMVAGMARAATGPA